MICEYKPDYLPWLLKEENITTIDNKKVTCYKLEFKGDDDILNQWALHIRRHYISDEDLTDACEITGKCKADYLKEQMIPQKNEELGPTVIAGDIAEIIILDVFEFEFQYKVPRVKMENRSGKNNSEHGTDVIAFNINMTELTSQDSEIIISEVKANLSQSNFDVLNTAMNDFKKNEIDHQRYAHTLEYLRKKCKGNNELELEKIIARFEQKTKFPYKTVLAPAGISSVENVDSNGIVPISNDKFQMKGNDKLIYVHGRALMLLAYDLYRRACLI